MNGLGWIGRDLRHAVRSLVRDRTSVVLALVALSLGIGSATVIFSVAYSVFVNTLPYKDPGRVVHFYITAADRPGRSAWYPVEEFLDYRAQNQVFSDVLGGASMEVLYRLDNGTYRVRGAIIDPHALRALGVAPVLGRDMTDADGAANAPPTFLMSDRMWNERFNRDPDVLGMTLDLNGTFRTLIAVLPPRVLLHNADVFFPTTITPDLTDAVVAGPANRPLDVWTYARLKPGVSKAQAAANIDVIAHNEARLHPTRYPQNFSISVVSLADAYTAESLQQMVYILIGAVLMLLLIACSNVANLLLARAAARETELALRASLGSSRARLMHLLLAESFVLAVAGTIVGGALAFAGLQWARAAIPANLLPAGMAIRFSTQAFWTTIAVTVVTTLLCGIAPALRAARGNLGARLAGSGKGVGLSSGHGRLRTIFVTIQVTLAIVLLVGAGLMMRTLISLRNIDPGIDTTNVLVGRFSFPQNQRATPAERSQFVRQVVERVGTIPGVLAASPSIGVPLEGSAVLTVSVPGGVSSAPPRSMLELVGSGYFRAIGLSVVNGRPIEAADVEGARHVAVVNRAFVRQFFGETNPIGRPITFPPLDGMMNAAGGPSGAPHPVLFDVVGVVADARNGGLERDVQPEVFLPFTAPPITTGALVVKAAVNPLSLQHQVEQEIWKVDRGVALMNVATLDDLVHRDSMAAPAFGFGLLGTFAAIGLVLAAIGVFSVMAYSVSLQTRDIGIRIALGAEPRGVLRMALWKGLRPVLVGVVLGAAASYALSRLMANQIYGVTATDPWTFAAVVIILIIVGAAACVLPARRATRIDPLTALRAE
jgi:putative ABC transport system permease protein